MNPETSKVPAPIKQIELNEASFEKTPAADSTVTGLTYVNFFFGNNGTGKSTIAKAIKNNLGITYNPGSDNGDYFIHLYDEDYIQKNFESYHGMQGLFTMDYVNIETQQKVEEMQSTIASLKEKLEHPTALLEKKKNQLDKLDKSFKKEIWDKTKEYRESVFPETQTGYRSSQEKLANRILESEPKDIDESTLKMLYDSAFSDDAKTYPLFDIPEDPYKLDNLPGLELMEKAIVNTSTSTFAEFFSQIGATEWVKAGHKHFSERADGLCPYCQQKLPDDFEEKFKESFDDLYEQQIATIEELFHSYGFEEVEIMARLQAACSYHELYPGIDTKEYDVKYEALNAIIEKNKYATMHKVDHPNQSYKVEPVGERIEELCNYLKAFNRAIATNNEVVAEQGKKREECIEDVFSFLAFYVKENITHYQNGRKMLVNELENCQDEIDNCSDAIAKLQEKIRDAGGSKVDTSEAMKSINAILRDSGMQGFHLEPHETQANVYKVVRENGQVAKHLSEGEKNFIAFLYFYYQVQGLRAPDDDKRNKIVIIDDPVSSMDSNSLFIVSTLVRNMVEVCRNNADTADRVADGNYIKQLFVLTHNAFFHREITYNYVKRYAYASFFLIKKRDNKSTVELCTKLNPDAPTQEINYNPVKSSYAALWEEYKQLCDSSLSSAVPLLNVTRKILDYYFLQLCGYDGSALRREILNHKDDFKDASGNSDDEQYTIAKSMLAYISASKISFSDGLHYVEESADSDMCRRAFETIFIVTNQRQHYTMMIEA